MDIVKQINEYEDSWRVYHLENGLTIVHLPRKNDIRFALTMHIKAGSRWEQKSQMGISHFLEHMMFRPRWYGSAHAYWIEKR